VLLVTIPMGLKPGDIFKLRPTNNNTDGSTNEIDMEVPEDVAGGDTMEVLISNKNDEFAIDTDDIPGVDVFLYSSVGDLTLSVHPFLNKL